MTITFIKIVAPNILFEILDNSTLRQMSFFGQTIPNKAPLQTNKPKTSTKNGSSILLTTKVVLVKLRSTHQISWLEVHALSRALLLIELGSQKLRDGFRQLVIRLNVELALVVDVGQLPGEVDCFGKARRLPILRIV